MIRSNDRFAADPGFAACTPVAQHPQWITNRQRKCQPIPEVRETGIISALLTESALDAMSPKTGRATEPAGLRAYGCVYHCGLQRLAVSLPGERAIIRFNCHSCLKRVDHAQDDAGITICEAGDYEIMFDLRASVKAAAPVAFEILARDGALPVGTYISVLPDGMMQSRGRAMAPLRAGDCVGVAMTSVSVCQATLHANGVSATLTVKKLD